ncbi:neuronal PAS domain-containing protein 4-like [Rhinichthys klamathensis goyatoka]|uniref:neuronal PAS domain-containing protein 4-like n=1 Tax=Rhinichthys klamathensis goyatoka TaxID=3034132 RepID=UPI0024B5F796|nr:neuronal PAS domain-containing protein 4-like [Rhinichthys klamathensis goyatoka]
MGFLLQISVRMSVASVRRSQRASKRFRSTKGASKARRDLINAEIRSLRELLPIGSKDHERLSYLHSMALICTFIRKSVLLTGAGPGVEDISGVSALSESFLQALPGFIVALTEEGKLLYVSENVEEHLGLSMVDVLQGDSFYDMMDSRDAEALKLVLRDPDDSTERSLVCRMRSSKAFRLRHGCGSTLVKGRFLNSCVFVALCSPTADRLQDLHTLHTLHTLHRPDMSLAHAPYSVVFHLGFSAEELIGRSWYGLLHPDDITLAARCHTTLLREEGDTHTQMLVRLQHRDLSWVWIYACATIGAAKESISCTSHVISEMEAVYLKHKLYGSTPVSPGPTAGEMRIKTGSSSETGFFPTPPYSPTSCHSSDFLSDDFSALEQLVSDSRFCPPAFAASHPYSATAPAVCVPDSHLVPVCVPDSHRVPVCVPDSHRVPVCVPDSHRVPVCVPDSHRVPVCVPDSHRVPVCVPDSHRVPVCVPDSHRVPVCVPNSHRVPVCVPDSHRVPVCVPDSHRVPVCVPDSHRVPVCVPVLDTSEIPEHFLFGPDLTPEPSPSADTHTHFLYGPPDSGTLDTHAHSLAHQIRSLDTHWPLLDETVIDGILRDLDAIRPLGCVCDGLVIRHSGCVCDGVAVRHLGCVCDGPSQLQHCLYTAIQ